MNDKPSKELIEICKDKNAYNLFLRKENKHLKEELFSVTSFLDKVYDKVKITQRIWHVANENYSLQMCLCGKIKNFDRKYSYCKDCFPKVVAEKIRNRTPEQKEYNKNLHIKTNLEKYGVSNVAQSKKVKEKIKNSLVEKYGGIGTASEKIRDKIKKTNLEKYGTEIPIRVDSTLEKRKNTCKERYGVDNVMQNQEIKENLKKSLQKLYGVDNIMKSDIIDKDKYRHIRQNIYTPYNAKLRYESNSIKYVKYVGNQRHILQCKKCGNEFVHITSSNYRINNDLDLCPICNPINNNVSFLENQLYEYISSIYKGEIIRNNKTIISPYEIDIYIPELKLAIEFNGDYWHANPKLERFSNPNDVHSIHNGKIITNKDIWDKDIKKYYMCKDIRITMMMIFENDWTNNKQRVMDDLKIIFG